MSEGRIFIKNLASWEVGFRRKLSMGDVVIAPNGKISIDKEEIINQVYDNNALIKGSFDEIGSHATIYIEDEATRKELEFDSEDGKRKQFILDDDTFKKMFELKTLKTFKEHLTNEVLTQSEKFRLVDYIRKAKVNDYDKIRAVEEYVGIKMG